MRCREERITTKGTKEHEGKTRKTKKENIAGAQRIGMRTIHWTDRSNGFKKFTSCIATFQTGDKRRKTGLLMNLRKRIMQNRLGRMYN